MSQEKPQRFWEPMRMLERGEVQPNAQLLIPYNPPKLDPPLDFTHTTF